MRFMIMLKLVKECAQNKAEELKVDQVKHEHKMLKKPVEYRLEASVDILKLYSTLNGFDLEGSTALTLFGDRSDFHPTPSSAHSPTIIFPEHLTHDGGGGSVSSYLSPLSNTTSSVVATSGFGEEPSTLTSHF